MSKRRAKWIDKDRGWNQLRRAVQEARRKPHVQVGIFGGAASADHDGIPNIKVAAAHELGLEINHPGGTAYFVGEDGQARFVSNDAAKGRGLPRTEPHKIQIPERSFIRGTIDVKTQAIVRTAKGLAASVLAGRTTTKKALEMLGLFIQGEIRKRISTGIPPPLKAATIKRKGSSKPLIDTGQMRASVDYRVRNA